MEREATTKYAALLVSPVTWWQCLSLVYWAIPEKTEYRLYWLCLSLSQLGLICLWCWLYYTLAFDSGQYFTLMGNVADSTDDSTTREIVAESKRDFNMAIRYTITYLVCISFTYALILAMGGIIAAELRDQLVQRFHKLQFHEDPFVFYNTATGNAGLHFDGKLVRISSLPDRIAVDVSVFANNLTSALYGGLFFYGALEMFPMIAYFADYIVRQSGETSGIIFCFVGFTFCILLTWIVSAFYSQYTVASNKAKSDVRKFIQRLLTFAECIGFYNSAESCEWDTFYRLIIRLEVSSSKLAYCYPWVNFPIGLLGTMGSVVTYIMPAIFFFYVNSSSNQTTADAVDLLGVISFYGFLFSQLASILYFNEVVILFLTSGSRLYQLKEGLELVVAESTRRSAAEIDCGLRQYCYNEVGFKNVSVQFPLAISVSADNLHSDWIDSNGSPHIITLQNAFNANVVRGETLLICGPSGCGKSSMFRLVAGLWKLEVDSKTSNGQSCISSPPLDQIIFFAQRPFLSHHTLRKQLTLLMDATRASLISDCDLQNALQLVRLSHLIERYGLDSAADWISMLSVGEQQRLAFARLFVFLQSISAELRPSYLVMLDESTSAIDFETEVLIYRKMLEMKLWFVTISHRSQLAAFHSHKIVLTEGRSSLSLPPGNVPELLSDYPISKKVFESQLVEEGEIGTIQAETLPESQANRDPYLKETIPETPSIGTGEIKFRDCLACCIRLIQSTASDLHDILKLLHAPFPATHDGKVLFAKTLAAWLVALGLVAVHAYYVYQLAISTASIFSVLGDYAAGDLTIAEGRNIIGNDIGKVIGYNLGSLTAFCIEMGIGQYLAALYSRRQCVHLGAKYIFRSKLLFFYYEACKNKEEVLTEDRIVSLFASDIPEMNSNLFHFLFGSIYYNGIFEIVAQVVAYSRLLALNGGSESIAIIFICQLVLAVLVGVALLPYLHYWRTFVDSNAAYMVEQQRLDMQAESFCLSPRATRHTERDSLNQKFSKALQHQKQAALSYGIFVFFSMLSLWFANIISFLIPSIVYFYFTESGSQTSSSASRVLKLATFASFLQSSFISLNYGLGQPWSQVYTLGKRISITVNRLNDLQLLWGEAHESQFEGVSPRRSYLDGGDSFDGAVCDTGNNILTMQCAEVSVALPGIESGAEDCTRTLIKGIHFSLSTGQNLLISGLSGCGKSELLRLLAGVRPVTVGSVVQLHPEKVIYVAQRHYLIVGTLYQQLNYFLAANTVQHKGYQFGSSDGADEDAPLLWSQVFQYQYGQSQRCRHGSFTPATVRDMKDMLTDVGLVHLIDYYTLSADGPVVDWAVVLSGGEQQRIIVAAMLLYPKAQCFVFDETTSSCDTETEAQLYSLLLSRQKQFITVSHRPELNRFHSHKLIIENETSKFIPLTDH